jgi:hypothetical protein
VSQECANIDAEGVGGANRQPLRVLLQFQSNLEAELDSPFPDKYQVEQQHQKIHRTSFPLRLDLQTPLLNSGVLHVWSPEPIRANWLSANREQNLKDSANTGWSDICPLPHRDTQEWCGKIDAEGVGGANRQPLRVLLQFQSNLEAELDSPFPDKYQVEQQHQKIHRTSFPLRFGFADPALLQRGFARLESGTHSRKLAFCKPGAEPE